MKKNYTYKFLISLLIYSIFQTVCCAKEPVFVSLSPALTEVMYAINAQDILKGVSTSCTYPKEAQQKEILGDTLFINEEKIISLHPDYILAPDSSVLVTNRFKRFGIKPLCYKNPNIESIKQNILSIGKLTNKEEAAKGLIKDIDKKISEANLHHNKKILYLIQSEPMISIGRKSFITDIIEKSGNHSISSDIDAFYPIISEEYAIASQPDIVILSFSANENRIKKLFPKAQIIYMTPEENDIVNRPGPRIYKSVEFFAKF